MKGNLIVIEGTDCSGKETQSNRLMENLNKLGRTTKRYSFPNYDSPTGKIVGGPYLGKKYICEGWFPETAPNVDAKVSSLYYAADRKYNIPMIIEDLNKGIDVILDRYTFSNMAHQGGKLSNSKERQEMYDFIDTLEFKMLGLPFPNIRIFIHMPLEAAKVLKEGREEAADQNEANEEHLKQAEKSFLEIAKKYDFKTIEATTKSKNITIDDIKSIDAISKEIMDYVEPIL